MWSNLLLEINQERQIPTLLTRLKIRIRLSMNEVIIIVYPYKHNLCFRLGSVHNSRSYRNNPFLWSEETNINPSWKGQSEIKSGATFNQTPWLCCIHTPKQNCRVDIILILLCICLAENHENRKTMVSKVSEPTKYLHEWRI